MGYGESLSQSRALGSSEENWTRSTAGGTGISILGIALQRHVDMPTLKKVAKTMAENHAILRSQLIENPKGKLSFEVQGDPWSPVVEEQPWPTALKSEPSSGDLNFPHAHPLSLALHEIVTQELNTPFISLSEKTTHPIDIFRLHVYFEHHHRHTVIILRCHGGAMDRHSSVVAGQQLMLSLNAALEGKAGDLHGGLDKAGLLPSLEDLIPKGKASKNFLKKGLDAVSFAITSAKNSLLPFHPDFISLKQQPFRSDILNYSLGIAETTALFAACKRENTTYAAALSAAILKVTANVKDLKDKKQETFSFTSVMSCRPYFEPPMDDVVLGNYSTGIPQVEQVKEAVAFWDLARRISAFTEKELSKSHHFSELSVMNLLFTQVLKHPTLTPNSSLRTSLFTLFVDGPLKFESDGLDNLHLAGTFGPFASMHFIGPCMCVGEVLNKGPDLNLSFTYPTPIFSRTDMDSLLRSAFDLLKDATKK